MNLDRCSCKFCKERRALKTHSVLLQREIAIERSEGRTIFARCDLCGKRMVAASETEKEIIVKCEDCETRKVFRDV